MIKVVSTMKKSGFLYIFIFGILVFPFVVALAEINLPILDIIPPASKLISPLNNSYTKFNNNSFVANLTDNEGLNNTQLYIWNSSSLVDTVFDFVSGTDSIINLSFPLPSEGFYYWNYLVNDTAGNSAFSENNFTIIYDKTPPSLNYSVTPVVFEGYTNNNTLSIFVEASDSLSGLANIAVNLFNSSGKSNSDSSPTSPLFITYPVSDGVYLYNISASDLAGNIIPSENQNLTVDTLGPALLVSSPPNEGDLNIFLLN